MLLFPAFRPHWILRPLLFFLRGSWPFLLRFFGYILLRANHRLPLAFAKFRREPRRQLWRGLGALIHDDIFWGSYLLYSFLHLVPQTELELLNDVIVTLHALSQVLQILDCLLCFFVLLCSAEALNFLQDPYHRFYCVPIPFMVRA